MGEDMTDKRLKALKQICDKIAMEQPEAIGMAFIELDCGCLHVCGVSAKGDPIGKLQTIPGSFIDENPEQPVCFRCYREKRLDMGRAVRKGLVWPGDETEIPAKELRENIGKTVFGLDFIDITI